MPFWTLLGGLLLLVVWGYAWVLARMSALRGPFALPPEKKEKKHES